MKKSLFFFAAAALALTACTNDDDALQTGQVQNSNRAVAFDTYTAGTTRAGEPEGVMTTDKLKTEGKGFGVFAFYQDNEVYANISNTTVPNFMYNEHVSWTPAGGWAYPILKYWPNETTNDLQTPAANANSPELDKLSFFAYAPYVSTGSDGTLNNSHTSYIASNDYWDTSTPQTYGIMAITQATKKGDPLVEWKYSSDIDKTVDLLWGVAAKDADYTAVNGTKYTSEFGKPLFNMVKPDKDQRVKFLFQHALSRVGLTVASAIDQIAAGDDGDKFNATQTRVLIEDVVVWGDFSEQGVLNLNNTTANVANWSNVTKSSSAVGTPFFSFDYNANHLIAKDLRYSSTAGIASAANPEAAFLALNEGVLPSEKVLIAGGPDESKLVTLTADEQDYSFGTAFYTYAGTSDKEMTAVTVAASEDVDTYIQDANGNYIQIKTAGGGAQTLDGVTKYYKLTPTNEKTGSLTAGTLYYEKIGSAGHWLYKKFKATGSEGTGSYYLTSDMGESQLSSTTKYAAGTYYKGLTPRYFMVIPSDLTPTPTNIGVKITYHVITYDPKLGNKISDVKNVISQTTKVQLQSGKSYNLKLILGLTSVKIDATVGEWQVADNAEIWLPQNVE